VQLDLHSLKIVTFTLQLQTKAVCPCYWKQCCKVQLDLHLLQLDRKNSKKTASNLL